ncbi:hypothetical protein ARTHRO9AX_220164 [Arthrobacter sp. 9AX]|uniref:SRPBCC family protein n=1 Tax=Arthrobacter sp. 9AX TaxID=2653131 RepID=UPI0012F1BDF8|nr:SRPBCC family protein [Arthrobacter sp. 9AX]VXC17962.1 hypothetical protein ARTHRO9AX_220164 [Arthrobacter sp. 9AX]
MNTKVEKRIVVDVPVGTAYNQWTQFEEFPHFMSGVESVTQVGDGRLRWVAHIAGVRREWEAKILEQIPAGGWPGQPSKASPTPAPLTSRMRAATGPNLP